MPLPTPSLARTLRHTRTLVAQGFERDDGLWDIDCVLTDAKTRPVPIANATLEPNASIHELWLRVTIDKYLNIVDAVASSDAVPYPGVCNTIAPAYAVLKGLNLFKGFRNAVRERLSGTAGCTHLSELCNFLPSAAIQAFAGDVWNTREGETDAAGELQMPFQLDRCHALAITGEAVKTHYPRWYKAPSKI
jgi:Protein of unknown function (DUF2889)